MFFKVLYDLSGAGGDIDKDLDKDNTFIDCPTCVRPPDMPIPSVHTSLLRSINT